MFTGLVDHCGRVETVQWLDGSCRLFIRSSFSKCVLGESIAVDGVCLTVVSYGPDEGVFACDVSAETLRCSRAAGYQAGSSVNLERPMRMGDAFGGHWVLGHVDGQVRVHSLQPDGAYTRIDFVWDSPQPYVVPKGSVALNGVSLTANSVTDTGFSVMLTPHTWNKTNLSLLGPQDAVNIEYDYLAKVALAKPLAPQPVHPVEKALAALKQGQMVLLTDPKDRENEGDFICAAQFIDAQKINFMATHGRGLICLALTADDFERLQIPMMVEKNRSSFQTPFGVSFSAVTGVTTGISAADRAHSALVAIDPKTGPADIVMPGHLFPLKAHSGGLKARQGHTEGSVELMKLAGLKPAALLCEVMEADGSMARGPRLQQLAQHWGLALLSTADILDYKENLHQKTHSHGVNLAASARLPIANHGDFSMHVFHCPTDNKEHIAIFRLPAGCTTWPQPPLVRLHSECLTGDVLHSTRCDCGPQLDLALDTIAHNGGVVLYLRQEGRGIGLINKIKAYAWQDKGLDTVEANQQLGFDADNRDYKVAADILKHLGITTVRLLTNNPEKCRGLQDNGIRVAERVSLQVHAENAFLAQYLKTKKDKMGHIFTGEST